MNTFLTLDLIFFILVAVFLIIRLRGVLGRRTGNEKRPKDIFMYQDTTLDTDKKKILDKLNCNIGTKKQIIKKIKHDWKNFNSYFIEMINNEQYNKDEKN